MDFGLLPDNIFLGLSLAVYTNSMFLAGLFSGSIFSFIIFNR